MSKRKNKWKQSKPCKKYSNQMVSQCDKLSILNVNIRSLDKHFNELEAELQVKKINPTLIGLTETFIKDDKAAESFKLPGYHKLITCNRTDGQQGGVALWISNKIGHRVLLKDTTREWLVVEILCPFRVLVGVTYRREGKFSRKAYCEWLDEELQKLGSTTASVIVCGDFNIDILKSNCCSTELEDIMKSSNLFLVTPREVTRRFKNAESCLDHIYSDLPVAEKIVYQSSITDHYMVWTEFEKHLQPIMSTPTWYRNFKPLMRPQTMSSFQNGISIQLENIDWNNSRIDQCFASLNEIILDETDIYAPYKRVLVGMKNNWIDNTVKRSINKRDIMHKMMCDLPDDQEVKHAFTIQRNKTKSLIRKKKRQHIQSKFDQSIGDPFHRNLNEVFGKGKEPILPTFDDGKTLDDFNKYFALVGIKNREGITPTSATFNTKDQGMSLFKKPTNENEVSCIIKRTKNTTSMGIDGISNKLLKLCIPAILPAITTLFNRCMRQGYFRERMKIAKITPVYKKGNRENFVNYRPISLLPCISKVFERVIYARLINYIDKFDLLSNNQYGFRKKRSTIDALTNVIEQIRCASNDETQLCIFLDLKKAFDTIDHSLLFGKLYCLGIRGPVHDLLKSYLTNRLQFICIKGSSSQMEQIN